MSEHDRYGVPTDQRRLEFEHLVLRGIWVILWIATLPSAGWKLAGLWRHDALHYLDKHGRQGDDPKLYRRDTTMPELPNRVELR